MLLRTIVNGKPKTVEVKDTFEKTVDVCVIGLGTAGAIAAIAAAQGGVSVIGVERTACLGGMGSAACVWDYFYGTQGGLVLPINKECYRRIEQGKYVTSGGRSYRDESIPGAVKNIVLRGQALDAGCELLMECRATGVFMEDDTVCGVQVFDGKKMIRIRCSVLIDGTEGVVCRLAGCNFLPTRPYDDHTMHFSHMFGEILRARVRGSWKNYGFPEVNSAEEWSQLILQSAPQYNGGRVVCEASMLGVREVPCVQTDEVYTLSDVASGKRSNKPLFYGFSKVDNLNGDNENEVPILQDWKILCTMEHRYGISVGVPIGTVIPQGKEGLLIASRAKGLDHALAACMRMKFDLEKSGEAVGRLAALACQNGCSVREVPYKQLAEQLMVSGCLNVEHDIGLCDLNEPYQDPNNGLLWRKAILPQTVEAYKTALSSREPGPALWCLRNHCTDEMRTRLQIWLGDDNRLLAENSAIALGMQNDPTALPMLRDIIHKPPVVYYFCVPQIKNIFGWEMASPFCNFTKAILLLGRFRDTQSVPRLREIAKDHGRTAAENLTADLNCPPADVMAKEFEAYARAALREMDQK